MSISGIDMDATGKKISQLINKSGLSDKELSGIIGLSVQSINKWRHGHNLPDIENLFLLSRVLGIKVDDFLVPLVTKTQLEVESQLKTMGFSVSAIHRIWVYCNRIIKLHFNHPLNDNPA